MFKKLLFKFEILRLYFKRNYVYLILGLGIGATAFFYRSQIVSLSKLSLFHSQLIGLSGLYKTNNLPSSVTNKISYGLTQLSENNRPNPSELVEKIEVDESQQNYTITLKKNIFWHDGDRLSPHDISLPIEGLKIIPINSTTFTVRTEKIFAPLLSNLSLPLFKKNLIGLGEYRVKKIIYKDGYISQLRLVSKNPFEPQLIYRFYTTDQDLLTAYKLGEIDTIETNNLPENILNSPKNKVSQKIQTDKKYSALFFNTIIINNKQTRQALAYATPKTKEKNERCLGPISPKSWGYNPSVKEYNYNPDRAKELFENNKITEIKISVVQPELLPLAETIKQSWSQILNIKVDINLENQIDSENFQVVLAYGGIPTDPDQYPFWHSTQTRTNITHLNNPKIDKLLEEGRQTLDLQKRKEIYLDFQKYLLEESPAVFLSYPTIYTVSRLK